MGIKSFFQGLGRSIKKGFNSFVNSVGGGIGGAGEYLQRKAIPAIANISNQVAGGIGKAMPVIAGVAPELAGPAEEAQNVLSKVGSGAGALAKFIGSDIANKPPVVANADQILAFSQSPFGMAIRKSQGLKGPMSLADATSIASGVKPAPAPAPAPALISDLFKNMPKGLISPAPAPAPKYTMGLAKFPSDIKPFITPASASIPFKAPMGSNSNTYTPPVSSGIEAPPSASSSNITKVDSGIGGTQTLKM